MIRWNRKTNTLMLTLPRWRDRRLAGIVFFLLIINLFIGYIDRPVAEFMAGLDQGFKPFLRDFTELGDSKFYLIPIALIMPFLFAIRQAVEDSSVRRMLNWAMAALLFIFIAVAGSGLFVNLLKIIFGRTRPELWLEEGLYGFAPFVWSESDYWSMPSGHTNTAFAFAAAVSLFIPRLRGILLALAVGVAISRVMLTRHYVSDVIAGATVAMLSTYWLRAQFAKRGWVFIRRRGVYQLAAPGFLLGQKLRAFMWNRLGMPDGARGRLPR